MSIDLHFGDARAEVVLNRPERLNAIDDEHLEQLFDALVRADRSDARVILLRAEGRAFCAGRDLSEMKPGQEEAADVLRRTFNALVMKVASLSVPTIAAVQGPCLGGGTGLALACDLVVAADDASFASPFGRLGAVPDSGFHWFLTTRLGPAIAKDLALTGRQLSGSEAAALGLIARAVPSDSLRSSTVELARAIAAGPTRAYALACGLIDRSADGASLADVLAAEAVAQAAAFETADLAEGFAAFEAKRPPQFTGR